MKLVIGIDPGKKGAVVALGLTGKAVEWMAADEPGGYVDGGQYLPRVLADWLGDLTIANDVVLVVIEKQQARPVEGRTSCLTTGYGWGLLTGLIASAKLPRLDVTASVWVKAILGTAKGERKARSVAHCQARVPDLPLTWGRRRKAHDGLADAANLALYGLRNLPITG